MGVLVAHLAVLIIWDNYRSMGKPRPKLLEPTFFTATTTFTNARGEAVKVLTEFTVQTELAKPELLEQLPPAPAQGIAEPAKPAEPAASR